MPQFRYHKHPKKETTDLPGSTAYMFFCNFQALKNRLSHPAPSLIAWCNQCDIVWNSTNPDPLITSCTLSKQVTCGTHCALARRKAATRSSSLHPPRIRLARSLARLPPAYEAEEGGWTMITDAAAPPRLAPAHPHSLTPSPRVRPSFGPSVRPSGMHPPLRTTTYTLVLGLRTREPSRWPR